MSVSPFAVGVITHNSKGMVTMEVLRDCLKLESFTVLGTHGTVSGTGPGYYQ